MRTKLSFRPRIGLFCAACWSLLALTFAPPGAAEPRSTTIRYAGLVDRAQMIRTGQTVGDALVSNLSPSAKGALQPFLDPYTSILPEAVEMENGPAMTPYRPVEDLYPAGDLEPAWVGIVRGGRIVIQSDGLGHARLFLPGNDAARAYSDHYPVIRHCLASLAAVTDGPLQVEAYAYRHDYSRNEFTLQSKPYFVRQKEFPPPAGRIPLDLDRLESFFSLPSEIVGAEIDPRAGLVLQGAAADRPTLDGRAASLADLAVAYRAVFHAGDNAAFISLDPNADPTRATVNFGGYLENTSIGRVVLEADKRFKTITTGLDPDSFQDVRGEMARAVPGFISAADRDLGTAGGSARWIGTRFWFYPETVEIETEADYSSATIGRARFRADAERQRGDFSNNAEFERFRALRLSPSVRQCIDGLNADYDRYAALFPELRELSTVARLLGVCAWLKKRPSREVDLDALLAVSLPSAPTPRSRTQMLSASWKCALEGYDLDGSERSTVQCFSPQLDRPIGQFFDSEQELGRFLGMMLTEAGKPLTGREPVQASTILSARGAQPVRTLLRTQKDVQAFARYMAQRESPHDSFARRLHADYERLVSEIRSIQDSVAAGAPSTPELRRRHSELATAANAYEALSGRPIGTLSVISIGGGINLGPDDFRIRVRPRRSSRSASRRTATPARQPSVSSRNLPPARPTPVAAPPPPTRPSWTQRREEGSAGSERRRLDGTRPVPVVAGRPQSIVRENYWFRRTGQNGSWHDRRVSGEAAVERSFQSTERTLTVTRSSSGRAESIVARRERGGAIVFERAAAAPATLSAEQPAWWEEGH